MSLLRQAKQIRQRDAADGSSSDLDIVFDSSSGISEEDQRDILRQIEGLSHRPQLAAPVTSLKLEARKRGVLFPALVNIGALFLLGLGLFSLSMLFRQSENQLREEGGLIRSAEGRLIQEIKKEAEALIRHKDEEISSIMARLGEIDRERRDLTSNMEARIKAKEEELRRNLEKQLEEERQRLGSQGLSALVIDERMKKFEEEKTAQFLAELAAFKIQLESERQATERSLENLQGQFRNQLTSLNKEREAILADSRSREADLRAQLQERTRALEAQDEETREQLSLAQSELRLLEEQKERSALVDAQIQGFFATAEAHLRQNHLPQARETLDSLKTFLQEPAILSIPDLQDRRLLHLAVSDMLIRMIDQNLRQSRESLSISRALQSDPVLEEIRRTAEAAEEARQAGDDTEAERLYRSALGQIPDILSAYEYLAEREGHQSEGAAEALKRAENAFAGGNYSEAWRSYAELLSYLPIPDGERGGLADGIQRTGYEILAAEDSAALTALRQEKAAAEARLQRQNTDLRRQYESRIAGMEGEIRELRRRLDAETAAASAAAAASAPAAAQTVPPATQQELRRLEALEADLNRAKSSYAEYSTREDGLLRARGDEGFVEAKLLLDTFLASEGIRRMFPGLDDRIKRYDRAFQTAGADDALLQASDIALRLSTFKTRAEKDRFLAEERDRRKNDPAMRDFLDTLGHLLP